jgi:hypothetical protein
VNRSDSQEAGRQAAGAGVQCCCSAEVTAQHPHPHPPTATTCSDEVQSVVNPPKAPAYSRRALKRNPLKNLGAMLKLNPQVRRGATLEVCSGGWAGWGGAPGLVCVQCERAAAPWQSAAISSEPGGAISTVLLPSPSSRPPHCPFPCRPRRRAVQPSWPPSAAPQPARRSWTSCARVARCVRPGSYFASAAPGQLAQAPCQLGTSSGWPQPVSVAVDARLGTEPGPPAV